MIEKFRGLASPPELAPEAISVWDADQGGHRRLNCDAAVGLIPLLSFGIPASNSTAILPGGFLIHGLNPGPVLFDRDPEVLYGVFTGLFVATFAPLPVAWLTLPRCIWLVNKRKPYIMALILALVFSGTYSINNSLFDLSRVLASGVLGFGMRYFALPLLPTVLGLVLGYMIESNRRALVISGGDHMAFLRDPISAIYLFLAVVFLAGSLYSEYRQRRERRERKKPAL